MPIAAELPAPQSQVEFIAHITCQSSQPKLPARTLDHPVEPRFLSRTRHWPQHHSFSVRLSVESSSRSARVQQQNVENKNEAYNEKERNLLVATSTSTSSCTHALRASCYAHQVDSIQAARCKEHPPCPVRHQHCFPNQFQENKLSRNWASLSPAWSLPLSHASRVQRLKVARPHPPSC